MMYIRKNTVNAIQIAMTALILLTDMNSFSCDIVFCSHPLLFTSSNSTQCFTTLPFWFLRQQFVHLILLSTPQHVPQTAYGLDNLGKVVAKQIAKYISAAFD